MKTHDLLAAVLGRERSLFADDFERSRPHLAESIRGARLLVIGAAGSIGAAFLRVVTEFRPSALHLVDGNENELVEVVRDLRSSERTLDFDFKTWPLLLGGSELTTLLAAQPSYDVVLNFAALKHVRSEKDGYSLMRMVRTNVVHVDALSAILARRGTPRFFSVSSDKAVRPVSLMGATKAFMERAMMAWSDRMTVTSARFANVAFSNGSLLDGFRRRVAKRQPLSAPTDVRRYFISELEAGELCALAACTGLSREIFFPKLDESRDTKTFAELAEVFLRSLNLEPDLCASEPEARAKAQSMGTKPERWPCYFFASDTSGEKDVEEFHLPDDELDLERFETIGVVRHPLTADRTAIDRAFAALDEIERGPSWAKEDFVALLRSVVPELSHLETGKNLDQRM